MPFPYHARNFVKLLSLANNPDDPITSPYLMRQVLSPFFGVFPSSYNGISKSLSWSQKRWIVKYIHVLPITRAYGLSGYFKPRTYFTLHPSLWQANIIKNKIFFWLRMLLCCDWNLHRMAFPWSVRVHACWPGNAHVYSQIVKWNGILFSSVNKL